MSVFKLNPELYLPTPRLHLVILRIDDHRSKQLSRPLGYRTERQGADGATHIHQRKRGEKTFLGSKTSPNLYAAYEGLNALSNSQRHLWEQVKQYRS